MEAYLSGVSIRKVDGLVRDLGADTGRWARSGPGISPPWTTRMCS
jgi:hypothetical protein